MSILNPQSEARLRSRTGRLCSPWPVMGPSEFTNRRRVALWLVREAEAEIGRWNATQVELLAISVAAYVIEAAPQRKWKEDNSTHAFYVGPHLGILNLVVFGNEHGPTEDNLA